MLAPPWELSQPWWGYRTSKIDFNATRPAIASWNDAFFDDRQVVERLREKTPPLAQAAWTNELPSARLEHAVAWMQAQTSFSGFHTSLANARPLETVIADGAANNFEKALLLERLLSDNGVKAQLAFVGRNRGLFFDPEFPLSERFDHMLVWVLPQGDIHESLFVDPSCEACGVGQIPDWSGGRTAAILGQRFDTFYAKTIANMHFEIVHGKSPGPSLRVAFAEATLAANGDVKVHKSYTLLGTTAVDAMLEERKKPTPAGKLPAWLETLSPTEDVRRASRASDLPTHACALRAGLRT